MRPEDRILVMREIITLMGFAHREWITQDAGPSLLLITAIGDVCRAV